MRGLYSIILLLFHALLFSCEEPELAPRDYPRLHTLGVSQISESGATFSAEFAHRGAFEILRYGFVWSDDLFPMVESSDRIVFTGDTDAGAFSAIITTTLEPGVEYVVRPFVETADYLVYGSRVTFVSLGGRAPVILDFLPKTGSIGDTVSIIGEGFSYKPKSNTVHFVSSQDFTRTQATVVHATDTLLRVIVPGNAPQASVIVVEVAGKATYLDQQFVLE